MASADDNLRDTSVNIVVLETSEVYIVTSLSTAHDTQVIYVDPTTGLLCYCGNLGHDLFNSEEEALSYITDGLRIMRKSTTYARAILGYAALGSFGLLLVATRLSATITNLPGGGCVYTVAESQWVKIQLQNPQPQGKCELKNIQDLVELDIDGKHYFCETRDITRTFPSPMTYQNPDDEFVWNGWFSKPFKDIGLPNHCVILLQVLSRPSGFFLKPVPSILPVADGGSNLLSFRRKDIIWVCPPAADVVEIFIYLGEPCHVSQLLLTISHGAEDSSYPATVDVRTGCNLDGLKLVLEGACIPHCSNGTNLVIPLTGRVDPEDIAVTGNSARLHSQEHSYLPLLYNFEELEGELNFLTRVVALTFYPSVPGRTPLTLGEIEVLGVSLPWTGIFTKNGIGVKFINHLQATCEQNNYILRGSDTFDSGGLSLHDSGLSFDHETFSSKGSIMESVQPGAVNHGIDLLTGDLLFSHPLAQPDSSSVIGAVRSSGSIVDFFDNSDDDTQFQGDSNLPAQLHDDSGNSHKSAQHYIQVFKSLSASNKGKEHEFNASIKA